LTGDLMEPDGGERHYCERLVRLPNLGVAYPHPGVPATAAAKGDFGIAEKRTVFLSCQSVYKYLPQHDHLFPAIAQRVPEGLFVFVETGIPAADAIFRQRLKASFAQAGLDHERFCLHVPMLDYVSYRRLIAVADVFLDTLAWSGGNTTMEAVASRVPIVTLPGEFMRGRHSFAILRMLELDACIAKDEADYIRLASELGERAELRGEVRAAMQARMEVLFEDAAAVRGLYDFFQTVAAAWEASA
jgi:predicted O-linked N-acetylglucosamine transferase (SPINDLY family)